MVLAIRSLSDLGLYSPANRLSCGDAWILRDTSRNWLNEFHEVNFGGVDASRTFVQYHYSAFHRRISSADILITDDIGRNKDFPE